MLNIISCFVWLLVFCLAVTYLFFKSRLYTREQIIFALVYPLGLVIPEIKFYYDFHYPTFINNVLYFWLVVVGLLVGLRLNSFLVLASLIPFFLIPLEFNYLCALSATLYVLVFYDLVRKERIELVTFCELWLIALVFYYELQSVVLDILMNHMVYTHSTHLLYASKKLAYYWPAMLVSLTLSCAIALLQMGWLIFKRPYDKASILFLYGLVIISTLLFSLWQSEIIDIKISTAH